MWLFVYLLFTFLHHMYLSLLCDCLCIYILKFQNHISHAVLCDSFFFINIVTFIHHISLALLRVCLFIYLHFEISASHFCCCFVWLFAYSHSGISASHFSCCFVWLLVYSHNDISASHFSCCFMWLFIHIVTCLHVIFCDCFSNSYCEIYALHFSCGY